MSLASVELFQALCQAGLSDEAALDVAEQFTPEPANQRIMRQAQTLKVMALVCAGLTMALVIKAYLG